MGFFLTRPPNSRTTAPPAPELSPWPSPACRADTRAYGEYASRTAERFEPAEGGVFDDGFGETAHRPPTPVLGRTAYAER